MDLKKIIDRAKKSNTFIVASVSLVLFSSIITVYQGFNLISAAYRQTVGYANEQEKKVKLLSADTNISYYNGLLGDPVFVNWLEYGNKEYVFVNKYFYVQAITNETNRVLAYSVTTRVKNFNPEIELGPWTKDGKAIKIKLGVSKFVEVDTLGFGQPDDYVSYLGAHDYFYSEEHYFGNPGKYQTYFFSLNQSGYDNGQYPPFENSTSTISNFRSNSIINTYTITSPLVNTKNLNLIHSDEHVLGPVYNQVRILNH